jgi:hypothetical protein
MQQNRLMQQEKDPLNLGGLPLVSPPADDWPVIEAALKKQNSRRRIVRLAGSTLAAAAVLILAVGVFVHRPGGMPTNSAATEQLPMVQAENSSSNKSFQGKTVDSLIALSQQLETNLRRFRSQVGVMPSSTVIYQVELEDLVAQVDEELSMRPGSVNLWGQRVNLLLDLSQLYQNELRREYHRMASL